MNPDDEVVVHVLGHGLSDRDVMSLKKQIPTFAFMMFPRVLLKNFCKSPPIGLRQFGTVY